MPIEPLPQATIRAIGSTSVISDPCSVVKELLDNALDASASSVSVEISPNTVDTIQVKDNGHGVPVEDHPFVCKHAFTSKISTIDDLKNVGGTTLGFRGEALASIAEMSGGILFVTRTASSMVGSQQEYGRKGELIRSQKTAHPVGSTVRVRDFLKHIPVRRQGVLKGSVKCLGRIKKLLQDYSLAQPSKRFSLKVLRAKNENHNWSFIPGPTPTLVNAAIKVIGHDAATSCTTEEISMPAEIQTDRTPDRNFFKIMALLPKVGADASKIRNKGQFVSIDGRPLSTNRGFGHEVVKLFKTFIRAAWTLSDDSSKSTNDPFLCVHITCPPGSYDVNIEPGKDDVLLEDREVLLDLIEKILTKHYGVLPNPPTQKQSKKAADSLPRDEQNGFSLLMARKPPTTTNEHSNLGGQSRNQVSVPLISRQSLISAGLPSPESTPNDQHRRRNGHTDTPTSSSSLRPVTSWYMSVGQFPSAAENGVEPVSISREAVSALASGKGRKFLTQPRNQPKQRHDPETNVHSRLTPVSPLSRRPNSPLMREQNHSPHSADASRKAVRARDKERYGNGALDTWFQRLNQTSLSQNSVETQNEPETPELSLSELAEARFNPSIDLSGNSAFVERRQQADPTSPAEEQRVNLQQSPEAPPVSCTQARPMNSGRGYPVLENWAASVHEGFVPASSLDLEQALDFERRKREVNRRSRTRSLRPGTSTRTSSSARLESDRDPHAEITNVAVQKAFDTNSVTPLSAKDPRAYLIYHQSDQGVNRRVRTSKLPLERVTEEDMLFNKSVILKAQVSELQRAFHAIAFNDGYTRKKDETDGLSPSNFTDQHLSLNRRLVELVSQNFRTDEGSRLDYLQIDIATILADHEKRTHVLEAQKV
ncbi:hypothetical protein POX_h09738 [Penicillium oxalicum]|uniref:hypothetical protein n=1 Tax=Penicillium oxalicum TaxID=69781 RepID=UPI0020B6CDCA|nr:hypothetical protein POX_h09738 [Penicillium oxalicum]KAI2785973.1 hypothetical protein POX_h09738 [Penicillium oxalicum]